MLKPNVGVMKIEDLTLKQPPSLLVLYDRGQDKIVQVIADVLGKTSIIVESAEEVSTTLSDHAAATVVVGMENGLVTKREVTAFTNSTVITTHAIDVVDSWDEELSILCNFEYLYFQNDFVRHDLVRFLGFVLGLTDPHTSICQKRRSNLLSVSVPDVCAVLPNLDISTIGADAIELRVDQLKSNQEANDSTYPVHMKYVGEQVMRLRQATELPIVFTVKSQNTGGRFPIDDPALLYTYLRKAMQWGCEYIDVELWLLEKIRQGLAQSKRNTKIISSFHDHSGQFRWSSQEALKFFKMGALHGDIVKISALATSMDDNFELEAFRETVQSLGYHQPFCAFNSSTIGEMSQIMNKFLTPITHPWLTPVAASDMLSAAEINIRLDPSTQMPQSDIYATGTDRCTNTTAAFFQKCLNELNLSYQIKRLPSPASLKLVTDQPTFRGAFISHGTDVSISDTYQSTTEAATQIGEVEIILPRDNPSKAPATGDNISWKAIRSTLTRNFVSSAFEGKSALIIGDNSTINTCLASVFTLKALNIGSIHSIGFKMKGPLANHVQRLDGIEDLKQVNDPFIIISILSPARASGVLPLLKFYSDGNKQSKSFGKVFLDLSPDHGSRTTASALATDFGWHVQDYEDVRAWTVVETLRVLSAQYIGFDFTREHI